MPFRNVVSWSAMIACYAKNEKPFEALELFRGMMIKTHDLVPNSVIMVSVLQACAAVCFGARKVYPCLRRGLDSVLPVISALITMYSRCGELELGQQIFDWMEKRDVVHAGLVEGGKRLFDSIKVHGMIPSVEHYACMVGLLGRSNRLEEAARIIDEMRMEPGAKVWGSLLGSCRIHWNYVLLADIYAEAQMWDDIKQGSCLKLSRSEKNESEGLYDLDEGKKEQILLGHGEKLAVAFGLIDTNKGETIKITKNLSVKTVIRSQSSIPSLQIKRFWFVT
ncbi:Myosin heavy chain-related [Hibiscus syriacus]|uniref:Myosin heavy chain-related n=1 Tax=Hibiscus syriacus TaxID=106335 RepID=A0A6A2ZIS8_HIBSY|nr:Myosin heavy chain-related [Hibiscus syriacus]